MGAAQSTQVPLIQQAPPEHKRKVEPLLRANHKHSILLQTDPPRPNSTSQILSAASFLEIDPVSLLFDLWDVLSQDTIDVTDSHEEIVETDYLSPENLGFEHQSTRYVDFFDDEIVRHLYNFEKCAEQYLKVDQVVEGLLARDGWAAKQLAYAIEMKSKDMCTEALGGALTFYRQLDRSQQGPGTVSPNSATDVIAERDELIEATIRDCQITRDVLNDLVVLNAIGVLKKVLPDSQFNFLWSLQANKIRTFVKSSAPLRSTSDLVEVDWKQMTVDVLQSRPEDLIFLRLLKDHHLYGASVALEMFGKR